MPIKADNTRLSIDFQYEYQLPDGSSIVYNMKFMHTPQGPVVTLGQEGFAETAELPADMFAEVYRFLHSQGAFRPTGISVPQSFPQQENGGINLPMINRKSSLGQSPVVSLPNDQSSVAPPVLDQTEVENIIKQRAAAKAKANTEKAKIRSK